MEITVNGLKIFYERNDGEGEPIIILHGWGASTAAMKGIFNFLAGRNRTVFSIDFPGFGNSEMPPADWGVYDYADLVHSFTQELHLDKPIFLGHSFGGRIAIILGSRNLASKLILVDAAGLKPKFSLSNKLKICGYKLKKKLRLKTQNMGSADYLALDTQMRTVFVRVVNTHLDALLKLIKVPTLLVWGANDEQTPLYMAKKLNKKIATSGLVILKDCGHYCFGDNYHGFCRIVNTFV